MKRTIHTCALLILLMSFVLPDRSFAGNKLEFNQGITGASSGIHLSYSDNSQVILDLDVPVYGLVDASYTTDNTQSISLHGAGTASDPGKPALPIYSALIGVPAGAQVTYQVIQDNSQALHGKYNIRPAARPNLYQSNTSIDGEISNEVIYDRDEKTYTADALYPASPVKISKDAWIRDQRVILLEFYPFQYNPRKGSLLWHKHITARIQFNGDRSYSFKPGNVNNNTEGIDSILQNVVLNYDVARNWRGIPQSEIYHPDLRSSAGSTDNYDPVFLGPRYRITVDHTGLYRLTYDALQQAQPIGNTDPDTFHLYNQGRDVAIYVDDGGDGTFNSGDSVYFFGEEFNGEYMAQRYASESNQWITLTQQLTDGTQVPWHPEFDHFMMEKYTDKNIYWLTVGGVGGPRMQEINGDPTGSSAPIPATYPATVRAERELRHWEQSFTSTDSWFWDFVTDYNTHIYTTTLTGIAPGEITATVRGEVASYSFNADNSPDHHTRFMMNSWATPIDDAYWDGKSRYHFEGQIPQSELINGVNELKFTNLNDAYAVPYAGFDFFEVDYTRLFTAEQNKLLFAGKVAGAWRYRTGGYTTGQISVLDITDPVAPIRVINPSIISANGTYSATFLVNQGGNERYFVAGGSESPEALSYYQPPAFDTMTQGYDYIIITHPDFLSASQTLADYRAGQGMSSLVVNVNDLYAEFNDGIFHPLAIKNFLAYTFAHWEKPPIYVLLIGDGSWHMKNTNPARYGTMPTYMPPNLNWVDPWLGQTDSSNLLAAVVGDDILPDLLIGRLPVTTNDELSNIVTKITSYEQSSTQDWQRNSLFIADDTPDPAGDFVHQSETIIDEFTRPGFNNLRIYLDDYKDNNRCGEPPFIYGPTCLPVNRAITETVSLTGTLFLNYAGHAGTQFWTSDKILDYQVENPGIPDDYPLNDIASMHNGSQLPIVLSMTCWDGHWFYPSAHPSHPSLSELWLRTSGRGAVAVFSAAGLGVESGHVVLQEGFYKTVFNSGIWQLGLDALGAKLNIYQFGGNLDLINTYLTFGDPALRIPSPYRLNISPNTKEETELPGYSVTYALQVTNSSQITDTIEISNSNNSWPVSITPSVGVLFPGQSRTIQVTVDIPSGTNGGLTDTTFLTATSMGDRSKKASTTLITTAVIWDRLYLPVVQK